MTRTSILPAALIIAGLSTPAMADERLSHGEVAEIEAVLDSWGCTSYDEIEKEDGLYEIDDAKCGGREYDIKLDANFYVVSGKPD